MRIRGSTVRLHEFSEPKTETRGPEHEDKDINTSTTRRLISAAWPRQAEVSLYQTSWINLSLPRYQGRQSCDRQAR